MANKSAVEVYLGDVKIDFSLTSCLFKPHFRQVLVISSLQIKKTTLKYNCTVHEIGAGRPTQLLDGISVRNALINRPRYSEFTMMKNLVKCRLEPSKL